LLASWSPAWTGRRCRRSGCPPPKGAGASAHPKEAGAVGLIPDALKPRAVLEAKIPMSGNLAGQAAPVPDEHAQADGPSLCPSVLAPHWGSYCAEPGRPLTGSLADGLVHLERNGTKFAPAPDFTKWPGSGYSTWRPAGVTGYTGSPPAPGAPGLEQVLVSHGSGNDRAGNLGSGRQLPGGFGWLDDPNNNCQTYVASSAPPRLDWETPRKDSVTRDVVNKKRSSELPSGKVISKEATSCSTAATPTGSPPAATGSSGTSS
jgi:hypothetical protein